MTKKQKKMLVRILITAVMLIALNFIPITGVWQLLAYVAAYLVIGYDILRKAGKGILNGRAFDENFLMALATLGAFFLAIWTKSGDYVEGIAVMLFYQIGELFQSYAVGKSRKNISALMDIRPDYANIEADGQLTQVDLIQPQLEQLLHHVVVHVHHLGKADVLPQRLGLRKPPHGHHRAVERAHLIRTPRTAALQHHRIGLRIVQPQPHPFASFVSRFAPPASPARRTSG